MDKAHVMAATPETIPYQQHQPHDAGPTGLAPEGGGQEAFPQVAPADAWKKRPFFRGHCAPRWALALGLAVFVGLGGYAWHRANPTQAQAPGTSAAAATGAARPAWGTVPLTLRGVGRAQEDDPPNAFAPAPPRPKARGRHGYRHQPPAQPQPQPTFWQRLFGYNAQNQPG